MGDDRGFFREKNEREFSCLNNSKSSSDSYRYRRDSSLIAEDLKESCESASAYGSRRLERMRGERRSCATSTEAAPSGVFAQALDDLPGIPVVLSAST